MGRGKILITRKAHRRKAYTREDGTKVKGADIPKTTFKIKDRGAPGRTPKSKQWATFEKRTGWKMGQKPSTRRGKLLAATDKRRSMHDRYVEAGRMANQLANVLHRIAPVAARKARADANYFFRKAGRKK